MKVLVVDDEQALREILDINLSLAGFQVERAATVSEAREALQADLPDLILLNVRLAGEDGVSFCREIKGDPRFSQVKVVILSAKVQYQDIERGLKAGADDYLTKPFDPLELSQRLQKILGEN
jgi:DNA-binding response OmpR family regulator